jgi:L-ascorbate metabolism protein UlaG (beta-lactamase superfamily)
MRVTWYAHASFRIEANGFSVVCDPYDPDYLDLLPITDEADAVVVSSLADRGHSFWQGVPGNPVLINALDCVDTPGQLPNGSKLTGVQSWESDRQRPPGDPAKPNAMYLFDLDGLRIGHMGDIGDWLTEEQLAAFCGNVDVLFAPVGITLSIPLDALDDAIRQIEPSIVIPMHFFTPRVSYGFEPADEFLSRHEDEKIVHAEGSTVDIDKDSLPTERTIMVLAAANG